MNPIHIVGAGGIGCALAHTLAATNVPLRVVETDHRKLDWGNRHGVGIVGQPNRVVRFLSFEDWRPTGDDIVLLCTKCYDNAPVLGRIRNPERLVPVQNGFDSDLRASGHEVEGIASFVSECEVDRPVTRITRHGDLHLGPAKETSESARTLTRQLGQLLCQGPCRLRMTDDIRPYKNSKLLYNAAIGPLAAAAGLDNGALLRIPEARELFFSLLRENLAILTRARQPLGQVGPLSPRMVGWILGQSWLAGVMARFFEPGLRGTYCSMAHDLPRGRTELENYIGYLLQLANDTPCPLNRRLYALTRRMAAQRIPPGLGVLPLLLREEEASPLASTFSR